ncbi:exonuclease domain-containing protein [Pontibacter sp. G13]|uniref:exonuclease domain-containing protein n=1 Tax=Pontibacter sp. G13 TaxID=3074898 RepID=UPI00288950FF|nr:exonuclease domain-containing protein [Pontibacter sp. G13]WNJ16118.1 exonuclease domain-containing protein [Pontibacter sp. G13]
MQAKPQRYAVIDLETTGGNPKRDRIIEVAIVLVENMEVIDEFTSLVNPGMPIPDFITGITGIDNGMVASAPPFYEVAKQIVEITEGAVFVAHNARFDYGFIQREFRSLGYPYTRKQLCTVQFARKVLPGLKSYSLKNLCKHLEITNSAPHRAMGDAEATTKLLKLLLNTTHEAGNFKLVDVEIANIKIPPGITREDIDALPRTVGVYYFYGPDGEMLYVGKSTNIRKRVISHFQGAHKLKRTLNMFSQIHKIGFEETGSELVALLLENEEIKRHQPAYNRAQRRTQFKFAVYQHTDKKGYLNFSVDKYDELQAPLAGFSTRSQAEGVLDRMGRKHELCPKKYGAERGSGPCFHRQLHICKGACSESESAEDYNERAMDVLNLLSRGSHKKESYLIIGAGRNEAERSLVWINLGKYRGYGYMEAENMGHWEEMIDCISPKVEAPDDQRIIHQYVKNNPKEVRKVPAFDHN